MTDFFALLGEEPRPWLEEEALKEKYHRLAALHHPDVTGEPGDFAEINRAYQTLLNPVSRVRHLLELEGLGADLRTQAVPGEVAVFFAPAGAARQEAENFLKKHAAAGSPLERALLAAEQYEVQERLEQILASLREKEEALLERVREVDARWSADRAAAAAELPELWQALGYVARWVAALRESLFRLAAL